MQRRTFVGLIAGAWACAAGKFTTETRAESKPFDTARMLEVTRVPGVAVARNEGRTTVAILPGRRVGELTGRLKRRSLRREDLRMAM